MDPSVAILVVAAMPWMFLTFVVGARASTAVFSGEKE